MTINDDYNLTVNLERVDADGETITRIVDTKSVQAGDLRMVQNNELLLTFRF